MFLKFQYLKNIFPGVILALIFCLFSQGINNLLAIEIFGTLKSPISTVLIAILLGILMGNAFTPRPGMMIGLDFTQQYILKLGIIFLGIRLSFEELIKFGSIAIPLIIFCIIGVLILVKLLVKKLSISSKMSYLIAIGTSVCGATAIVATAPVINAKKSEVAYAIANITLFGVIAMIVYPYFLIPLVAFLYNRDELKNQNYSILSIFPYFVIGFIGMIIIRNIGDQFFTSNNNNYILWVNLIGYLKTLATVFLTMAMAAVGISINLSELKSMGYKPFVVGLITSITVGLVSLIYIETLTRFI